MIFFLFLPSYTLSQLPIFTNSFYWDYASNQNKITRFKKNWVPQVLTEFFSSMEWIYDISWFIIKYYEILVYWKNMSGYCCMSITWHCLEIIAFLEAITRHCNPILWLRCNKLHPLSYCYFLSIKVFSVHKCIQECVFMVYWYFITFICQVLMSMVATSCIKVEYVSIFIH